MFQINRPDVFVRLHFEGEEGVVVGGGEDGTVCDLPGVLAGFFDVYVDMIGEGIGRQLCEFSEVDLNAAFYRGDGGELFCGELGPA